MGVVSSKFQRIRKRQKIFSFLRLIRLPNLLMVAACQLLVGFCLLEPIWWLDQNQVFKFLLLVISTSATAASGYIINDYYDIKIDILNKPRKVVVGKHISRRKSMIIHLVLIGFSIGIACFLGLKIAVLVTFSSAWLWWYSNRLKRLPFIGNFSVAVLTSLSVYIPCLLYGPPKQELFLFCMFAFWISLIREIVKDLEDMKGDARHGCQTLPILLGIRKTKRIIYGIAFLCSCSFTASAAWLPSSWLLFSILFILLLARFLHLLTKADTTHQFHRLSLFCKWILLGGVCSIVFI